MAKAARKRIRAGLHGSYVLVTITSPGGETAEDSFQLFGRRWKRLHQRMKRQFGPFEYVGVVELQARGHAHFHVVVRGVDIPRWWLSANARAVGFGVQAHVRPATSTVDRYLTKAIGPGTTGDQLPSHFHRLRWSNGWALRVPRPARPAFPDWYVAFAGTGPASEFAKGLGYRIVELVSGPPDRRSRIWPIRWVPVATWGAR